MGSKALERGGHRVLAYDARGHGQSAPAPLPHEYEYADLRLLAAYYSRKAIMQVIAQERGC